MQQRRRRARPAGRPAGHRLQAHPAGLLEELRLQARPEVPLEELCLQVRLALVQRLAVLLEVSPEQFCCLRPDIGLVGIESAY